MNNKRLGTQFEQEMVSFLAQNNYWVHFITPDARGSQPFDLIASRNNKPFVADCKTCSTRWFNISRLEENQLLAFDLWIKKGNTDAFVFVKYNNKVYSIPYRILKAEQRINLDKCEERVIYEIFGKQQN